MVLANYVTLEPGVPKRLHFTSHGLVTRELPDPLLGRPKPVRSLLFTVDREDGLAVAKTFSVTSEKLAASLEPYLANERYLTLEFVITKSGSGFLTRYEVAVLGRG